MKRVLITLANSKGSGKPVHSESHQNLAVCNFAHTIADAYAKEPCIERITNHRQSCLFYLVWDQDFSGLLV